MASAAAAANKRRLLSGNVAVVEDEDAQTRQKEAHSLSQEYSDELCSNREKVHGVIKNNHTSYERFSSSKLEIPRHSGQ